MSSCRCKQICKLLLSNFRIWQKAEHALPLHTSEGNLVLDGTL
uniref:Uncharacterized protein n=1 Tax=Anguilla anguilla TaxID=7936 RepID=A0A0E9W2Z9_ANGAN